jgi:branched-chain amino acid transport system permease protein
MSGHKWIWIAAGACLLLVYPLLFRLPFPRHLMIMIFLYASMGLAWNMIGGYAGQISLGHAVYFGAGAYTSTLLLMKLGVSPWVGMLAGGLLSIAIAYIIGYPCFKLAGHYFAIATIAIGEIVQQWMRNWDWSGAAVGLTLPILPESFINLEFHSSKVPYYYIAFGIFILTIGATALIDRSKLGYYFKAIKGDLEGARSLGINVTKYKFYALALSAFFTSICGSFYAQYVLFIDPDSVFPMLLSIIVCLIATLGGVGTIWGPVIGAFILIPISEFTRIHFGGGGKGTDMIAYGFLIMIISIYQPFGVIGLFKRVKKEDRVINPKTQGALD